MANEDSRENGVLSSAMKLATVGAMAYGGYRGGRGLIKNYDDLGETFLGGVGKKMSSKIDDGIKAFDKSDGTNAVREGLDKTQEKILQTDFKKQLKNEDKLYNNAGLELSDDTITSYHEEYSGLDRGEKRNTLKDFAKDRTEINKDLGESKYTKMSDYLKNDTSASQQLDELFNDGTIDIKGTRKLDLNGEQIKKQAKDNTQKL